MTLPVNRLSDNPPLNSAERKVRHKSPYFVRAEAEELAFVLDKPVADIEVDLSLGSVIPISEARKPFTTDITSEVPRTVESLIEQGVDPRLAAAQLEDSSTKHQEWADARDSFFLDHALANQNPEVSATVARYSANLSLGQRLFEEEMKKIDDETGAFGHVGEFIDRYLLRALPIGAFEQMTNRNERKGRDLVGAALTMAPKEYEEYIRGYIQELKSEGVLTGNNWFALADGYYEFSTAGYDPAEAFNRTLGAVELLTMPGVAKLGKTALRGTRKLPQATGEAAEDVAAGAKAAPEDPPGTFVPDATQPKSVKVEGRPKDEEPIDFLEGEEDNLFREDGIGDAGENYFLRGADEQEDNLFREDGIEDAGDNLFLENGIRDEDIPMLHSVTATSTPTQKVAVIIGPDEAADAAAKAVDNSNPVKSAHLDLQPEALDPRGVKPPVHPNSNRLSTLWMRNAIIREVQGYIQKGVRGRTVRSPEVLASARILIDDLAEQVKNPVVNVKPPVQEGTGGNFVFDVNLGTVRSGAPFKTEKFAEGNAKLLRDKGFPSAKAVPADPNDLSKGYYINVRQNMDVSTGIDDLDYTPFHNALSNFVGRILGSKAQTEAEMLNTLATMGEDASVAFGRAAKPQIKRLNKLSVKDKRTLNDIFRDLRDGPDAHYRDGYSYEEFARKWEMARGVRPTEAQWQGYLDLQDVSDAAYFFQANVRLGKYVERGYWSVRGPKGQRYNAKQVAKPEKGTRVYDISSGTHMPVEKLPKNTQIWRTDGSNGKVQYLARPEEVKPLVYTDVLGYNSGGRRLNPDAAHFIVANGRAVLSSFSRKQALKAQNDINTLLRLNKEGKLTDDLVREFVEWNPEIQTVDQFRKWMQKHGVGDAVDYKPRDGQVQPTDPEFEFAQNFGDAVIHQLHRSNEPLMEYGGGTGRQLNPVETMFGDFTQSSLQLAHNVHTQTAMASWVKAAAREGSGWNVPPAGDNFTRYMGATQVGKNTDNLIANQLGQQRNIINGRLAMRSEGARAMEHLSARLAEFVFDTTKLKMSRTSLDTSVNALLTLGMQTAFGFFNTAQLVVQGFHTVVVAAISPRAGMKSVPLAIALRTAISGAADDATGKLAMTRAGRMAGLTDEQSLEILDYVRTSARAEIGQVAVENGTIQQWGLTGFRGESAFTFGAEAMQRAKQLGSGALDAGLVFFREGERAARLHAIAVAHSEFYEQFPRMSANSDFGRRWIAKREQALSFRMTNANRAMVQEGAGKLPTQWFSYTLRSMENIFLGRDFDLGERGRMAAALTLMFGMTGFGAGSAVNWMADSFGMDASKEMQDFFRYGLVDWAVEAISGQELALAERLAPFTLLTQTYNDVVNGDKTVAEVALGPSGDILGGILGAVGSAVGNMMDGNTMMMTDDLVRALRNISGIDNIYKAQSILRNGALRSRTGVTMPFELDEADAIGSLLGFSPREVNEWYSTLRFKYRHEREVRDLGKYLGNQWHRAVELLQLGDNDAAFALMDEIELSIKFSGFSTREQMTLRRGLSENLNRSITDLIKWALENERYSLAERIEKQFQVQGTN